MCFGTTTFQNGKGGRGTLSSGLISHQSSSSLSDSESLELKLRGSGLESKFGPRGSKGSMSVDLVLRVDLVLTVAIRFFYVTSVVEDSTLKDGT